MGIFSTQETPNHQRPKGKWTPIYSSLEKPQTVRYNFRGCYPQGVPLHTSSKMEFASEAAFIDENQATDLEPEATHTLTTLFIDPRTPTKDIGSPAHHRKTNN